MTIYHLSAATSLIMRTEAIRGKFVCVMAIICDENNQYQTFFVCSTTCAVAVKAIPTTISFSTGAEVENTCTLSIDCSVDLVIIIKIT